MIWHVGFAQLIYRVTELAEISIRTFLACCRGFQVPVSFIASYVGVSGVDVLFGLVWRDSRG